MNSPHPATILVVDDTPANLRLLTNLLKGGGYKVRPVANGAMALRVIRTNPPDLILLDVHMPEMDGYEVCRRIKSDPRWRDIPVLFISALADTVDKVRAFEAGAVDYVGKPFQFAEVDARVRTHLELRRQRLVQEENLARLRELEQLRDTLTHMIAHDMRSPLLALQMAVELLPDSFPSLPEEATELITTARRSAAQVVEMVTQMLDVSRLEEGRMELHRETADLGEIARDAVSTLRPLAGERTITVTVSSLVRVEIDRSLIRRVVDNLLGNAIKFTAPSGHISVSVGLADGHPSVTVADDGLGIPPDQQNQIFEKYRQTIAGASRGGSGLGLTFCKMAIEAHGGSISVESDANRGSTFRFAFPAVMPIDNIAASA